MEVVNLSPTGACEFRLEIAENCELGTGARRTPGGTLIELGSPVLTTCFVIGSMVVKPCTCCPSGETNVPFESKLKAPARVYDGPSAPFSMKKPLPWIATLVADRLDSIVPCVNTGEIAEMPTPRPICVGFSLEPPTFWYTRSRNATELALKPTVLIFARLLPT